MTFTNRFTAVLRRSYSTTPSPYPFSSTAQTLSSPAPPPRTKSLLTTLNTHLTSLSPSVSLLPLFSRRSPSRLLPGSVITVTSYSSPPTADNPAPTSNTFSGVLIAIRRRHAGRDTSIRLRNMVGRTGVEVAYKIFSPLIKEIKVVKRAEWSGPLVGKGAVEGGERKKPELKAAKRAKLYFVRDQPGRLVGVGGIVKQQREKELAAETRKGGRR
ncbi:large subunit ribosomal protein L19, partial [Phenoliferia sp. Uapishka_3]